MVIGTITVSSWSCPFPDCPFEANSPTTLNGIPPILMVLLIGFISPKRFVDTVSPTTATFVAFEISSEDIFLPSEISHAFILKKPGVVPVILVDQF